MRELLPLSAYDVDRSVSFTSVGFACALWWFVAMTIAHTGSPHWLFGRCLPWVCGGS